MHTLQALDDWVTSAARDRPDHEAVIAAGRALSYAELDAAASRVALALAARGVGTGDRVEVSHPPGLEFALLLHALPRLGAVFVPRAPAHPPSPALREPATEPGAPQPGAPQPGAPQGHGVALRATVDPHAVHTVIHTSGTTGEPRPVELTYANHAAAAAASADALGVDPEDRWLCPLPLHHVGGLNVLIRSAVNRTTVMLHERFEVDRVKAALEGGEVTLTSLVPTMLARLRDAGLRRAPGLRAIALGGGPAPAGLLEWAAASAIPVVPVYGMTETCSQVVAGSPGRALRGVELRVTGDGEILVRGAMVAPGALAPDGWLHTGDRGRLDAEGLLHVEGRLKELIVSGGENVAPLEVERALLRHPAVADAGVAGLTDPEWGEAVTAFVVLRSPASAAELVAWCRERLASFKVPKAIHVVDELPRNANGKLLRDRLGRQAAPERRASTSSG